MNGLKEAALCLQGLAEADRQWILQNLPKQQRLGLQSLLRELQTQGIPGAREEALIKAKSQGLAQELGGLNAKIMLLDCVSAEQFSKNISQEPESLLALICRLHHWSWAAGFLAKLPAKKAADVRDIVRASEKTEVPQVMREQLVNMLFERCSGGSVETVFNKSF